MPPCRPIVLNRTDASLNLIVLHTSAQAPLKLTTTNYSAWRLQFTSMIFEYDLLSFVDGSNSCLSAMITLPDAEGFRGWQHLRVAAEIKKNPNKNPSKERRL